MKIGLVVGLVFFPAHTSRNRNIDVATFSLEKKRKNPSRQMINIRHSGFLFSIEQSSLDDAPLECKVCSVRVTAQRR